MIAEAAWNRAVARGFANGDGEIPPEPAPDEDAQAVPPVTVGPYTKHPYTFSSIINISGMSYGAISKPAVRALSKGAGMAGCWMNTGEGGLSPYHLEGGAALPLGLAPLGDVKPPVRRALQRKIAPRLTGHHVGPKSLLER